MQLTITNADGYQLVCAAGELDALGASALRERLRDVHADLLILNLGGLSFIDSAELHARFSVAKSANAIGSRIVFVVPPSSPVRRVVDLVSLTEIAPVCGSVEDALDRLPESTPADV